MVKLETKQECKLCRLEMTDFAVIVYTNNRPLCMKCIKFIKGIDLEKELKGGNDEN